MEVNHVIPKKATAEGCFLINFYSFIASQHRLFFILKQSTSNLLMMLTGWSVVCKDALQFEKYVRSRGQGQIWTKITVRT